MHIKYGCPVIWPRCQKGLALAQDSSSMCDCVSDADVSDLLLPLQHHACVTNRRRESMKYRVEQKKTLLSSVTHVPSGLISYALAALG